MSDEIYIKHNLGTFQQPYIARVPQEGRNPIIYQRVDRVPADGQQPSTYTHRSPLIYRDPRNAQTPLTYQHRSPSIYQHRSPSEYQHRSPSEYQHRSPSFASQQEPNIVTYQNPVIYRKPAEGRYPASANQQEPSIVRQPTQVAYRNSVPSRTPIITAYRHVANTPTRISVRTPADSQTVVQQPNIVRQPNIANNQEANPAQSPFRQPSISQQPVTSQQPTITRTPIIIRSPQTLTNSVVFHNADAQGTNYVAGRFGAGVGNTPSNQAPVFGLKPNAFNAAAIGSNSSGGGATVIQFTDFRLEIDENDSDRSGQVFRLFCRPSNANTSRTINYTNQAGSQTTPGSGAFNQFVQMSEVVFASAFDNNNTSSSAHGAFSFNIDDFFFDRTTSGVNANGNNYFMEVTTPGGGLSSGATDISSKVGILHGAAQSNFPNQSEFTGLSGGFTSYPGNNGITPVTSGSTNSARHTIIPDTSGSTAVYEFGVKTTMFKAGTSGSATANITIRQKFELNLMMHVVRTANTPQFTTHNIIQHDIFTSTSINTNDTSGGGGGGE